MGSAARHPLPRSSPHPLPPPHTTPLVAGRRRLRLRPPPHLHRPHRRAGVPGRLQQHHRPDDVRLLERPPLQPVLLFQRELDPLVSASSFFFQLVDLLSSSIWFIFCLPSLAACCLMLPSSSSSASTASCCALLRTAACCALGIVCWCSRCSMCIDAAGVARGRWHAIPHSAPTDRNPSILEPTHPPPYHAPLHPAGLTATLSGPGPKPRSTPVATRHGWPKCSPAAPAPPKSTLRAWLLPWPRVDDCSTIDTPLNF